MQTVSNDANTPTTVGSLPSAVAVSSVVAFCVSVSRVVLRVNPSQGIRVCLRVSVGYPVTTDDTVTAGCLVLIRRPTLADLLGEHDNRVSVHPLFGPDVVLAHLGEEVYDTTDSLIAGSSTVPERRQYPT